MPAEHVMKADGLRFAHSDGFTDISFSASDGRLISAGDDGYACISSDGVTDDSQMMHQLGDSVSCIAVCNNLMHAVITENTLSEFDFPACTFKRICLKLSDQITHFAANKAYSTLATQLPKKDQFRIMLKGGQSKKHYVSIVAQLAKNKIEPFSDFKIRLLDRESLSVPVSLNDHLAPVLSVAFSTGNEEILASSSCDSTVRLWSVKDGKCISTFGRVLPKSNDVAHSPTLCRLQFSNDSQRLYVPTEGEVKVYDVRNWQKPFEKIDLPKKTLVSSCVRFSKSGAHFAAICKDVLAIYSVSKSQWVARMNHTRPLCTVAWHPFNTNRLAFTDNRGQLGFVSAPIEETGSALSNLVSNDIEMAEDDDAALMAVAAQLGDDEISNSSGKLVVMEDSPEKLKVPDKNRKEFDFSDDEVEAQPAKNPPISNKKELSDDEEIITVKHAPRTKAESKSETKKAILKKFAMSNDDESNLAPLAVEENTNEEDDITDLGRIRKEFKEFFDEDEDDEEDSDTEGGKQAKDGAKTSTPSMKPTATGPNLLGALAPEHSLPPAKPADAHLQRAFQVHSTSAGRGGQSSRFLVWNQIGVVRLYESESESSIEAEFHDASVHPPISLNSSEEFTLAALTADVLVLASVSSNSDDEEEQDGSNKCRLRVLTLSAWDSSREWLLDLPRGEICTSVAVGSRWIAVVTDKQFVRLFSLGGFQLGILSIPGTPVTSAGSGDQLAVIYHNGIGPNQCQNLAFDLYKFASRAPKMVASGYLPVSPRALLTWAGFGQDFGSLLASDSSSTLRAYSLPNRSWTPIANLRQCAQMKSRADHYWMVGVSEKQQQIFAIFCKASTYPAVLPRPILSTVPLGVPVCDFSSDAGKLADEAIRLRLFNTPGQPGLEDADMKLQETLMRLFAIALKQERQCRAAEIAESMPSTHAIQLAGKYAARLRLGHLADVINEMAMKFEEEQQQAPVEEADPFLLSMDYRSSAPSYSHTSQVQETVQSLPVLATPPIVTLVKRAPGSRTVGLVNDFPALAKSSDEPMASKAPEMVEKVDDEAEKGEDGDDSVQEVADPEPKPVEQSEPAPSKNPFAKAKAGNPFKSRQSTEGGQNKLAVNSPGDAFSCFERVEPSRSKAPPSATLSAAKETGRKKKAADANKEDGPASAKKRRPATKRKSEAAPVAAVEGDEGSDNSKRSSSKSSVINAENEDESVSNQQQKDGEESAEKTAPAKQTTAKKAAPNASTMRKLTDFMFAKND